VRVHDLATLLGPTGTAATAALADRVHPSSVRRWLATGRLVLLHPGWVVLPDRADEWVVRAHAAAGYTGGVLSHWSALHLHGLLDEGVTRLDVTVPRSRRVRTSRWLRVHRSTRPVTAARVRGLPSTSLARALVDTWGDAHAASAMRGADGVLRGVVLRATCEGWTGVAAVVDELSGRPELPGREALAELLGHVARGSRSELEIRATRDVLDGLGLPAPERQHRVLLSRGPILLDAAWPDLRIAVEFDGAAFHGDLEARERDLRRDAELAALGWVVLRFGYRDVTEHPQVCRARIRAVHQARAGMVPQQRIPGPGVRA